MQVSVRLGAILIPEYLDFHSGYSAPRSRIAGINSGIYSHFGISQANAPLVCEVLGRRFLVLFLGSAFAFFFTQFMYAPSVSTDENNAQNQQP